MTIKAYDPKDVVVTFTQPDGEVIEIKGFADGTFVEVERDECEHYASSGAISLTLTAETQDRDVLTRLWSVSTERFRKRASRDERRRARMRRKKRRGWA